MPTLSCTCVTLLLDHNRKPLGFQSTASSYKNGGECLVLCRSNLQFLQKCSLLRSARGSSNSSEGSKRDLVVRSATPEAAAAASDLLSSLSLPEIPGFSLPADNPWMAGFAGLLVTAPFMIQRLLTLAKTVDVAAETVEKIADTVGKAAEEVEKAAEGVAEALPEGGLKQMVHFVEEMAEETAKDTQMVEDLMDKVEEIDDKLEAILSKQSKGTEKA